jgi:signal transduction histidine kinase
VNSLPVETVNCLIVDDREQNLVALESLLESGEVCCLRARSGTQALELLLEHEFALALIDIQMPGMDGFELAELMRGSLRTRRVPIIFLTAGTADRQRRFRGYEAGAVDFLQKPIEADILRSKATIFFELFRQRQEVARQRDALAAINAENARLLAESRANAAALQDADRRKNEFLATLAHELRNPLAPILNAVQIMRLTSPADPDTQIAHEIIERQVQHMVRLVDDLLDLSRVTRGNIDLKRQAVQLEKVADNAIETSRPLIAEGGHQFEYVPPEEPLVVSGDAVRLTQVISNLLNNAARYTPRGGRIGLALGRDAQSAIVTVTDTGIGIPAEMLENVFDMFTQINRHSQQSQGGLGIGLTLVKRIVDLHDGSVHIRSGGEGQGTTVEIHLPLAAFGATPPPSPEPAEDASAPVNSHRCLVIDDNTDALNSLSRLLAAFGHTVESASSGKRGIELCESFHPTTVFLDLGMPEMDGFETARRLRRLDTGRDVLLVAVTGWGQAEDRAKTRDAGFDLHLVKPIDAKAIKELLASTPVPT